MKIKLLPGYPTYDFKITWFDTLLAIEFIIACGMIAYVVGDMIVHAG